MPLLRDGQGEKATTKQQKKQKKRQKGAHNKGEQNNIIHVEHIISESEKITCYSSPTYGMANEIRHLLSEPSRLANSFFLYHDKPVPLLRDGQEEKTKNKERVKKRSNTKKGEQKQ